MNEMLNDSLAFQRYQDDVKRGETNYTRQAVNPVQSNSPRARLAVMLLTLAARLQPELSIEVRQLAAPATA